MRTFGLAFGEFTPFFVAVVLCWGWRFWLYRKSDAYHSRRRWPLSAKSHHKFGLEWGLYRIPLLVWAFMTSSQVLFAYETHATSYADQFVQAHVWFGYALTFLCMWSVAELGIARAFREREVRVLDPVSLVIVALPFIDWLYVDSNTTARFLSLLPK